MDRTGIHVDLAKIEFIRDRQTTKSRSELGSLLGPANYFKMFQQGYSAITGALVKLTSPKVAFVWDAECEKAFQQLKYSLSHTPVLGIADDNKPYELICVASELGCGAVLLQDEKHWILEL